MRAQRDATSRSSSDVGLARRWSGAQLLGSLLPIRLVMGTPISLYRLPSATAIALVVACPAALASQTMSSRPTTVSLTVVVPSRLSPGASLTLDDRATILHRGPTTLDVETMIGVADRPASRIEVRLGAGWTNDSAHVMVENHRGQLEALGAVSPVVALDVPSAMSRERAALRFRVDGGGAASAPLAIPVEYRITVGSADQIAIYSFPSVIQVASPRADAR